MVGRDARELKEWGSSSKRVAKGLAWVGGLGLALSILAVLAVVAMIVAVL